MSRRDEIGLALDVQLDHSGIEPHFEIRMDAKECLLRGLLDRHYEKRSLHA